MKNTLKKVLFSLWAIWLVWVGTLGMVNAQDNNTFWDPSGTDGDWTHTLNVAAGTAEYKSNWLIQTIKNFVNWILWMLSFIALVILLRWWFQMVTASGDETKYKKWFTILKQAAIWLAVIWLAWLFVTLILYLINRNAVATWGWQ